MNSNQQIGKILRDRRIELVLTLDDVAKAVGVSGATVSRWETGHIESMRSTRVELLSKALQISPGVIMGWEDLSGNDLLEDHRRNVLISKLVITAGKAKDEHIRIAIQLLQSLSKEENHG